MLIISNLKIPFRDIESVCTKNGLMSAAAKRLGIDESCIVSVKLLRKSLDARKKDSIHYVLSLQVNAGLWEKSVNPDKNILFTHGERDVFHFQKSDESYPTPPVIAGFGPAGLFAGLVLARLGRNPVILERGEDVDNRLRSVESFQNGGKLNTESNVQFGEGGAGTFSDGKLTTGIKSPYISFIFTELVKHGAPEEILYESKPHIGTDKLASVVKSIRQEIISLGGRVLFGARLIDYATMQKGHKPVIISAVYEQNGIASEIAASRIILAAGHSARDVFELLKRKNVSLSQKPFSVGVRIEHLQSDINTTMYGKLSAGDMKMLPSAEYKLALHLPCGRSVYSFCMCPGGYVVSSSSENGCLVTNGMSYYSRNGVNANSALLVSTEPCDFPSEDALAGIELQREIERRAFISGGGNYNAPVFSVGDFLEKKISENLGKVKPSYLPGFNYAPPDEYLPEFAVKSLREALPYFNNKIKGFSAPYAVLTGAETRSSSPVRINRGSDFQSISTEGLFPCGEGAGYAGGIVSAASDGIKAALAGEKRYEQS